MISIVIPTLNEERRIGALVHALHCLHGQKEVIVADGGSDDNTASHAAAAGARVIRCERSRGAQLRAGAAVSSGEVIWFVHADSIPMPDSLTAIETALLDERVVAGNFRLVFDGGGSAARQMTWIYPKLRRLGLSYGDAGIFVRRTVYDALGGIRPFGLFEDLDLLRRLKPMGEFAHLNCRLVTSSRRFERGNYGRAWAKWITLQVLYWLGVSPDRLARWYRPAH